MAVTGLDAFRCTGAVQQVVRELVIARTQGLDKTYDLCLYVDEKRQCLTLWGSIIRLRYLRRYSIFVSAASSNQKSRLAADLPYGRIPRMPRGDSIPRFCAALRRRDDA